MKYNVDDVVFHKPEWHFNCTGHEVLEAKETSGGWKMPKYKRLASKEETQAKSGFVWMPEWMLK